MLRWLVFGFLMFMLTACARSLSNPQDSSLNDESQAQHTRADLEDLGAAPELNNEIWLNTEGPLRLADLGGKVVLLDMWTFG